MFENSSNRFVFKAESESVVSGKWKESLGHVHYFSQARPMFWRAPRGAGFSSIILQAERGPESPRINAGFGSKRSRTAGLSYTIEHLFAPAKIRPVEKTRAG